MGTSTRNLSKPFSVSLKVTLPDGSVLSPCLMLWRGQVEVVQCSPGQRLTAELHLTAEDLTPLGEGKRVDFPAVAAPKPITGLGDVVERCLTAVGINKKPGCKCGKRQKMLNRLVPFGRKK